MGTFTGTVTFVGGKPPLNEDNINNLAAAILQATEGPELNDLVQRALSDWRKFLKDQFELTNHQREAIDSLGSVAVDRIQRSVNDAIQERSTFRVVAGPTLALPPGIFAAIKLESKLEFKETIGPDNKLQHQITVSAGISK